MNQLIIYIIQGLFIGICERIDTAFGNNIDIDSICVLSAFTIITWVTYCIYQMGSYSYRILMSKEKSCLFISIISGMILSIVIFVLSDKIPYLYTLTNNQYNLFSKCLRIHAISIPAFAAGEFLGTYILIKCMNKLLTITNIMFYTVMILLDFIVFIKGLGLDYLLLTTLASYIIYVIVLIKYSGILKAKDNITLNNLKICIKHSYNMVVDRILGKIATVIYNIYASKLGTNIYAIHCICYGIAVFTENITDAQFNYQIIVLDQLENAKDKFKKCIEILRKTLIPLTLLGYASSFILLLFMHGDVSINKCIIPLIVYCSQVFFIQLYESLRGYLTSLKRSELLKWAGLIGIFVRIPITLISYYSGIGIYGFAIASTLDFLCRGIYFYICHRKYIIKTL